MLGPNIKLVLQMRINKGLIISAKVQKSQNYPHSSHILFMKSNMTKVQRSGTLGSTFGLRKFSIYPHILLQVGIYARAGAVTDPYQEAKEKVRLI